MLPVRSCLRDAVKSDGVLGLHLTSKKSDEPVPQPRCLAVPPRELP